MIHWIADVAFVLLPDDDGDDDDVNGDDDDDDGDDDEVDITDDEKAYGMIRVKR